MNPFWVLLAGVLVVVGSILVLRLHPFLALLAAALTVAAMTSGPVLERYASSKKMTPVETEKFVAQSAGTRVAERFGATAGSIGILIAMAAVIGKCLLDTGAADRIIRSALRLFGERRAPAAFLGSGFVLGVPVFFDTVFYLMIPLGKALGLRHPHNYLLYVLAIIAGATMAHSLVPPTPGPLFAASALGVGLGEMMAGGIVVGTIICAAVFPFMLWINRRYPVPLRDSSEYPLSSLQVQADSKDDQLPPLWASLIPILLPVILIGGDAICDVLWAPPADGIRGGIAWFFNMAGDKNLALMLAAGAGLSLFAWRTNSVRALAVPIQTALAGAGVIILITSAGGAFGGVLQQTGIQSSIQDLAAEYRLGALPLAFFLTALVRTAQGSATVAMITAVGILSGMADPAQLGFHPVYLALAIGAGSKPVPWMNDSGFWIICKMSGMTERETFRSFSVLLTLMGLIGLVVIMVLAKLFPFV